jgi:crotonobetainyl-CoA:carnitine CoA-transferase CaiB-like acyl-CoA transferase
MNIPVAIFDNLRVVDFGLGLPTALVSRMLADLGAHVHRVEPTAGDPFYGVYPAYATWRKGAALTRADTSEDALRLNAATLAAADVCIVGGEDYPGIDWKLEADALLALNPKLVILEIGGHVRGIPDAGPPAVDILVQAYSGLVHEQYSDRPMVLALPAPSYGAALEGLIGVAAALVDRERTGQGQLVYTSLFEGTLSWLGHFWFASERSDWSMDLVVPKDAQPLIFRCADGGYLQVALMTGTARADIYRVLEIDDPTAGTPQRALPTLANGARNFYGDVDLLQSRIIHWNRAELLDRLHALGMAAEPVCAPGECWDDEQVAHNGTIWREADGGRRVGLPFTVELSEAPATVTAKKSSPDAPPLEGLRVVDFGTFAAGPHASMVLAELGADVIKVEALGGDPIHALYRPYSTSGRGKRHIAIDMKKPEALEIAGRLALSADMVHHNFRPNVSKRLGIDAEALHQINPALVVQENSGYGVSGPKSHGAGIDYALQALCGHEVQAAGDGGPLTCYNATTVDFAAGLLGAFASLAAQYHKARGGDGATVRTSLLDTGLFLLSELVQRPDGTFLPLPRLNGEQTGFHPAERLYRARDGWIAVAARSPDMAGRLAAALGLEQRISRSRQDWGAAEAELIAEAVGRHDVAGVLARLAAANVWAAPCRENAKEQTLCDEGLIGRGTILSTQHPAYGEIRQIGTLLSFSRTRTCGRGDTPAIGAQTREILAELGYDEAEIARLYEGAVVAG